MKHLVDENNYPLFDGVLNLRKEQFMNKEFIPYEQALELKELGFDEECISSWLGDDYMVPHRNWQKGNEKYISAPLYQQAFRWFREKHNFRFYIQSSRSDLGVYFKLLFPDGEQRGMYYNTYEEAELACLNKLIEIVKNK